MLMVAKVLLGVCLLLHSAYFSPHMWLKYTFDTALWNNLFKKYKK